MVNGVRGLCNGLGPALFGFIFYLFNVNLSYSSSTSMIGTLRANRTRLANEKLLHSAMLTRDIPGPPFLFGALLAAIAFMFSLLLPHSKFDSNGIGNDTRTIEQEARLLDGEDDQHGFSKGKNPLESSSFLYST